VASRDVEELRRTFDYERLTPEAKTSYDLWVFELALAERAQPFRRRFYTFHQMGGPHTDLPQALITQHRVDDASDMRAYVARIGRSRARDRPVRRAREARRRRGRARAAVRVCVGPAASHGARHRRTVRGHRRRAALGRREGEIDALAAAGKIDAATAEELRTAARAALVDRFKPAYDALIAWVDSDVESSDEIATGVWKLPDGPAFYEERLSAETTTDMTAEQIHALGLREVERIKGEMDAIRRQVGFDGTLSQFFEYVPRSAFHFPNTDEGREAYLAEARTDIAAVKQRLPEFFACCRRPTSW